MYGDEYQLPESSRAAIPPSFQQHSRPKPSSTGRGLHAALPAPCASLPGCHSGSCHQAVTPAVTQIASDTRGHSSSVRIPSPLCAIPGAAAQHKALPRPRSLNQQLEDAPIPRSTKGQGSRAGGKSHPGKSRIKLEQPWFYLQHHLKTHVENSPEENHALHAPKSTIPCLQLSNNKQVGIQHSQ